MRSVFQICLVTVVMLIACVIAGWELPETVFMASFVFIWQILFILLMMKIRTRRHVTKGAGYANFFWLLIFPLFAIFSPLLVMMVFVAGTIWDLCKSQGKISLSGWVERVKDEEPSSINQDSVSPSFERINYNSENNYPMGWKI
ncbi:entry exclusion protein [Salmonella enterica]|nr:entry exclusion protein [Salmonella enterica subsp. enterica serovar Sandiego]ECJ6125898.1 entry exclusion protein [Salmonella enterica]EDV7107138.1 entry exclusion protein [Salmonella enterica subsp. enterica]MLY07649.1 entry exclusion protein [Salmonella enterica subsp. enterica serovar Sandiego]